ETFEWFGSQQGWLQGREYEAAARITAGDHRQALDVLRSMEEHAAWMTPDQRAACQHNLGLCATEAWEFEEAARAFAQAAESFALLGNVVVGGKCAGAG